MKTAIRKIKKGFTLVEIMIVVAIIAILAAVAIPNFVRYRKTSQMNACMSNLRQIESAVEQARMVGISPSSMSDLVGSDKYIKTTPKCPSGGSYSLPESETANPTCSIEDGEFTHKLPTFD